MRPKLEIDWKELDAMMQFGPSLRFVADHFGVSHKTIERRIQEDKGLTFAEYKELKMDKVRLKLQQKIISKALNGDNVALIFALKNYCGWADKKEVEVDQKAPFKFAYDTKDEE